MNLAILQQIFEMYNADVEQLSLGTDPALVVAVLRACKEGVSSQKAVATQLKMSQSATTRRLEKFCDAGLMKYGPRQKDGSKTPLLTPTGRELVDKLESVIDQSVPPVQAPPTSSKTAKKQSSQEEDIEESDVGSGKDEEIFRRIKAADPDKVKRFYGLQYKVPPRFKKR